MIIDKLLLLRWSHGSMQVELASQVRRKSFERLSKNLLYLQSAFLAPSRIERVTFKVTSGTDARGDDLGLSNIGQLGANVSRVKVNSLLALPNLETDVILLNHGVEEL
jgi:hypothetical protein